MGQGRIAFPVQYFAQAVVSLSRFRSTRRSCNILHGFYPVHFRRNGDFAQEYAALFFCLLVVALERLSLLRRPFPSQESLGEQQTLQKPSPEGNHGVSEKVG